jgi:hypothetical protein
LILVWKFFSTQPFFVSSESIHSDTFDFLPPPTAIWLFLSRNRVSTSQMSLYSLAKSSRRMAQAWRHS